MLYTLYTCHSTLSTPLKPSTPKLLTPPTLHCPTLFCPTLADMQSDMEFVTNFTGIKFWLVNFTPQNIIINVTFHLKNDVILKKILFLSDFS